MAKVNAPLLSFEARGQIAKAVVYFPWKGINAVRQYVVPANPQSDDQTTQRNRMTAAVAEWHGAAYSALDVTAWNRYAGVLAKIMSGFNAMCKKYIEESILGNAWERLFNATTGGVTATGFDVIVKKAVGGNAPTVHYGTRKTHFPDSETLNDLGDGRWSKELAGLTAETLYYFYFDVGTSETDYARTGIYQERTIAA